MADDEKGVEDMIVDKIDHLRRIAAGLERGVDAADGVEDLADVAREGGVEVIKARNTLEAARIEAEGYVRGDDDDGDDEEAE